MKVVGLITNIVKDVKLEFTTEIAAWLLARKFKVLLPKDVAIALNMPECASENLYCKSDFLVALGGDGTMLQVSHNSARYNKPTLGINLGTLGYLTDVERCDAFTALENVISGNYKLERRMMLRAGYSINGKDLVSHGLNDVCISRGGFSKMIAFELTVNGEFIDSYRADGVIIATPTGSTAYNLSAGGPILKPDAQMIAVTPICPHMIHARPYVISADDIVQVKLTGPANDVNLAVDGQSIGFLKNGDTLTIARSKYSATIIKTNTLGFYDVLRLKMVVKNTEADS